MAAAPFDTLRYPSTGSGCTQDAAAITEKAKNNFSYQPGGEYPVRPCLSLLAVIILFTSCQAGTTPTPAPTTLPGGTVTASPVSTSLAPSIPMTSPISGALPLTNIPVRNNSPAVANFELIGALGGVITTVLIQGKYAYLGEGLKLVILDISEPANPRPIGSLLLPQRPLDIEVAGDYAYVAYDGGMS
jgi:hypothetical protein